MNYCSHCGSANLTLRTPSDDNRPRIICSDCKTVHYQNPKVVVGCLAFWEGKILLCRRAIEPRRGLWNLPAGFMENAEATDVGAAREVLEESGAVVDILRLHSVYSVLHANQVYMIFLANLQKPIFTEAPETLESRLFAIDEIPWDELAFNSNHFALRRYTANPDFTGVHLGDSFSFKAM